MAVVGMQFVKNVLFVRSYIKFLVTEARINSGFNKIGFYISHVSKYGIMALCVVRNTSSFSICLLMTSGSMMIVEFKALLCTGREVGTDG